MRSQIIKLTIPNLQVKTIFKYLLFIILYAALELNLTVDKIVIGGLKAQNDLGLFFILLKEKEGQVLLL